MIWQESMQIVNDVYKLTNTLPDYEKFGLKSQMNRCSVSIASNIAEGSSKGTDKYFIHFLEISLGSAFELETQVLVCFNQNFILEKEYLIIEEKISKLQSKISNFIDKLKSDS
jgi:four helix bundle protein